MRSKYIIGLSLLSISLILITLLINNNTETESFSGPSINIDVVYYINLDHRTDRKKQFLEEMKKIGYPKNQIQRISGVYKPEEGDLGCSLSHIDALTQFIHSPYHTCIIFEDDFEWVEPENAVSKINKFLRAKIQYDVCLLAGNIYKSKPFSLYPGIQKIVACATASGYIVTKDYAVTLLKNYIEGSRLLEKSYQNGKKDKSNQPYAIDQYWQKLQAKDNWFIFNPVLGKQRESFSDIMGGVVKPTS